jgi:hypothetical protein
VLTEEDLPRGPLISIPGGTRWIKITAPHPTQVIKVKKSTDLAVFYVQERPGQSQGRVNGTHRSDRQSFLRDYEPYTRRDWQAAQKVLAEMERQKAEADEEVPEVEPEVIPERAETQADLDSWGVPGTLVHEDSPQSGEEVAAEEPEASPQSGETTTLEPSMGRRTKQAELSDTEQEEIVELWRGHEAVLDIATTYNTLPGVIWNVVSTRVPDEYRLQRIVDQVKRNLPGPTPAYQISQWMHLGKAQVEELCTSEAAQLVLRYTIEVRDPTKPWIKTPMVELIPPPTPDEPAIPEPIESETTVATAKPPASTSETAVQFVITDPGSNNAETPQPSQQPSGKERFYRVVVRTTVEDRVMAVDIGNALDAAKAKYAGRGEVVAVMEE